MPQNKVTFDELQATLTDLATGLYYPGSESDSPIVIRAISADMKRLKEAAADGKTIFYSTTPNHLLACLYPGTNAIWIERYPLSSSCDRNFLEYFGSALEYSQPSGLDESPFNYHRFRGIRDLFFDHLESHVLFECFPDSKNRSVTDIHLVGQHPESKGRSLVISAVRVVRT